MEKLKFAIEDISRFVEDENPELAIAHISLLSTRPNAHKVNVTEEILRRDAKTILGKFVVGNVDFMGRDVMGHEDAPLIFGYFPKEQEIVFTEKDGYLIASADAVISKLYAVDVYDMFTKDNYRDISVEMMTYAMTENDDGSFDIEGLNFCGATVLGKKVNPACRDANMSIVQFSENKANEFYHNKYNSFSELKKFSEERRNKMAEKEKYVSHPIDTSKEAVDMGDWDGNKAKQDLVKEKNYETLAKKVCLVLEDGWKDREVTKLGYPVMNLKDGKWVYNAEGLKSAQGYSKTHDPEIYDKIVNLRKKLGLVDDKEKDNKDKKGGNAKMAQEKFAIDIGNIWNFIYDKLVERYPDKEWGSIYRISGIYEEDNKKFAIIFRKDETQLYKLDFDYTEEGLVLSEEITEVEQDFKVTDKTVKFEVTKDANKFTKFECDDADNDDNDDDDKEKMSSDANVDSAAYAEMLNVEANRNKELAEKLEEKENIIMEKDKELEELRKFKCDALEAEKMSIVNETLSKIKEHVEEDVYTKFSESGTDCKFEDITAWKNGVLATLAENVLQFSANNENHMRMQLPKAEKKSLWDRL